MPATLDERSVAAAFQRTAAEFSDQVALRTVGGSQELTWADYAARIESIAAGLWSLGVRRGDVVAAMMVNRPEFNLVDMAALHLGATPFSIYNTSAPEQIEYLFSNARNKVVVCEQQFLDRILAIRDKTEVEHVVCIDGAADDVHTLEEIESAAPADFDFEASWRAVGPDDLLTLIYTSGTTGPPKGVEISHGNMFAELRATLQMLPIDNTDRITSFLPHAHIADRWSSYYNSVCTGMQITAVADPRSILEALTDSPPTVWGSVPRIWEKMKAGIEAKIAGETDPQKKAGMEKAIAVGTQKFQLEQAGQPVPDELAAAHAQLEEMVLSKIRAMLGLGELKWCVVGAAPTPREVLEFFGGIGMPLLELWGMSELSCCGAINPIGASRVGTVGKVVPGCEVKLLDDGELCLRGPIVMQGYRSMPEKTAETITEDGWLMSGDVAEIDEDGYIKLIDRKKELIINAAGKNMSPANIEAKLKGSHPLIGQAVCIGEARPYNVALLVLDPDAAAAYAQAKGLPEASAEALSADEGVQAAVAEGVAAANEQLSRVEQIKKWTILPTDWLPGGEELTPTMKLKRKPIDARYADEIEALYAS